MCTKSSLASFYARAVLMYRAFLSALLSSLCVFRFRFILVVYEVRTRFTIIAIVACLPE